MLRATDGWWEDAFKIDHNSRRFADRDHDIVLEETASDVPWSHVNKKYPND